MSVIVARKKPVEIEAIKWDGTNEDEIKEFVGSEAIFEKGQLKIKTLEGTMNAPIGDYIIKGIKGEFYPCEPNIFKKTYKILGSKKDVEFIRKLEEMSPHVSR